MMSLGMGEYTLDSIAALPLSPRSYGRPSAKKKPSASTMTLFGTFVQSSIPLEDEKEEQAIRDWIYRGENDEKEVTITTPISPEQYGKGYKLLNNMGYQGHGSLNGNNKALTEPLSHTQGRIARDTTGLGFGAEDDMLLPTQNVPTSSDSEDDESPTMVITSHGPDFVPTTFLL